MTMSLRMPTRWTRRELAKAATDIASAISANSKVKLRPTPKTSTKICCAEVTKPMWAPITRPIASM